MFISSAVQPNPLPALLRATDAKVTTTRVDIHELISRGETERFLGAYDAALMTWEEIERRVDGLEERLIARLTRAQILMILDCPIEAAGIALDAVLHAVEAPGLLLRARATYAMAEAEAGNVDRAIESYEAWVRAEHDASRRARLLLCYSEMARRNGEPRIAIRSASTAAELAEELGDIDLQVSAQVALGVVLATDRGRRRWAQQEFRIARDLCQKTGDRASEARVLSLMADVSRDRGKQRRAEVRMGQALAIARELEDMNLWDEVSGGLGPMNPIGAELGSATGELDNLIREAA